MNRGPRGRQASAGSRQSQSAVDGRPSPVDLGATEEGPHAGALADALSRRVVIDDVRPAVDGGRFPVKRIVGGTVDVVATMFADGHEVLAAVVLDRPAKADSRQTSVGRVQTAADAQQEGGWRETAMALVAAGTDRWTAHFDVAAPGAHEYAVVGWIDAFRTWRHGLELKAGAGQNVMLDLLEGSLLIREAAARADRACAGLRGSRRGTAMDEAGAPDASWLLARADVLSDATPVSERLEAALDPALASLMDLYADRSRATTSRTFPVWVDRERAQFGAWYEMFPRSAGPDPDRSGTFAEAAKLLPYIADLGFDVVYLPPIHPIGRSFRKGPNNTLEARPEDPGSPWAIGSDDGGHTAVEPGLGTLDDFDAFRREAEHLGLELALDLAWQCSPDHPWVHEHSEWFRHRPDGSIRHAENPPKKYQDIYPLDFECDEWRALWAELLRVTEFWIDRGVRIFRVDNPHTKTFRFWGWLIGEVHRRDPGVIFLAEAFTRPAPMRYLAKVGFTQSYTYFTWKNSKAELTEYFTELTATEACEYLRPNLFANTPDILHAYLQNGGRPAFEARLLLAATLGANYGIYSGFELCEGRALRPGSEEYADSEKYQFRKRDWDRTGHMKELVARVNRIRRRHPALHNDSSLRFHATDNPEIIAYSKSTAGSDDALLVIVNLDPRHMQHGHVQVPLDSIRPQPNGGAYTVMDLLDDQTYIWRGDWNYVRFDPEIRQGHVLRLTSRV